MNLKHDIVNKSENSQLVASMRARFQGLEKTTFNPNRGAADTKCCDQIKKNGGYWYVACKLLLFPIERI